MMLTHLTLKNSLYYFEQHHLDTFNKMFEDHSSYYHLLKDGAISKTDILIIAFYIWLLLMPEHKKIYENVKNSMYFRTLHIIKNELIMNSHFENLRSNKNASNEMLFAASLFIANGLNLWALKIFKKYNLPLLVNQNSNFFDIQKRIKNEKSFFEEQAKIVKCFVWELKTSNEFHEIIKTNCLEAQRMCEKNMLL